MDIDKTPAIGIRALATPARTERDDEPTARHNTIRDRKSTEPGWPAVEPDTTVRSAPPAAAAAAPAQVSSETKPKQALLPSTPAPRAPVAASPGAYSQVSARTSRPSVPAPGAQARAAQGNTAPLRPLGAGVAQRPGLPASNAAAGPLARPRPKSKAAVDAPSTADRRKDSTPTRLLVPSGPVGSPYHDASPSKAPRAFETPPMPRALGDLTGRTQYADVLHVPADSLAPPTSAQRTQPPATYDEPSPRSSRAIWVVTGLLAAIILLAAGVSVRNWRDDQATTQRVAASQPKAPPASAAPVPIAPAVEVAPQPVSPELATELPAKNQGAKRPAAKVVGKFAAKPSAAAIPTEKAPAAASRAAASSSEPASADDGDIAQDKTARPAKPRGRNPPPIPDNPY